MSEQMSPAVADLLLRCLVALAEEGTGPKSYSSVTGPDSLPTDAAIWDTAAAIIGREKILGFLLDDGFLELNPLPPTVEHWTKCDAFGDGRGCTGYYPAGQQAQHLRDVHRVVMTEPSTDGIRPHLPITDRQAAQARRFADAFPGYCMDGSCGHCGACELRKDGG